ncbi:TetR family transcriptional regulator [Cellulomonas soli]|uniref:TetR/AcrR family transcriptional regulator n=1 Tax=Cellulomonas soli TaxID=931535 RepID=UPI003F84D97C
MARNAQDDDSIGAATRALADATATLTRLLGKQVSAVSVELNDVVAGSLREAARGLAEASESVDRSGAGRRRDKVDQTRADLLAAAGRVFAARGYEGASVGDIAAEAGYTKGALYAHFGSKSGLFLEFARATLGEETCGGLQADDLAVTLEESMRATVGEPVTLVALEIIAYGIRHPESRPDLAPLLSASWDFMAEQVRDDRIRREHRAAGSPDPAPTDTPPTQDDRDTALGVVAVSNLAVMFGTLAHDRDDAADTGARLLRRLLGH